MYRITVILFTVSCFYNPPFCVSDTIQNLIRPLEIFPGTKWCGAGNISDSNSDLGPLNETDSCCRQHDMCPDYINAGETKYNLTNEAPYTRVSCDCDDKFRKCLDAVHSPASTLVETTYFTVLGTQCFKKDYPAYCIKRDEIVIIRCKQYSYNTSGEPTYQWFDV